MNTGKKNLGQQQDEDFPFWSSDFVELSDALLEIMNKNKSSKLIFVSTAAIYSDKWIKKED